ncbi:MAG: hypothetical protein MHM6MM_001804 [Cercozoa sp. M6MM]
MPRRQRAKFTDSLHEFGKIPVVPITRESVVGGWTKFLEDSQKQLGSDWRTNVGVFAGRLPRGQSWASFWNQERIFAEHYLDQVRCAEVRVMVLGKIMGELQIDVAPFYDVPSAKTHQNLSLDVLGLTNSISLRDFVEIARDIDASPELQTQEDEVKHRENLYWLRVQRALKKRASTSVPLMVSKRLSERDEILSDDDDMDLLVMLRNRSRKRRRVLSKNDVADADEMSAAASTAIETSCTDSSDESSSDWDTSSDEEENEVTSVLNDCIRNAVLRTERREKFDFSPMSNQCLYAICTDGRTLFETQNGRHSPFACPRLDTLLKQMLGQAVLPGITTSFLYYGSYGSSFQWHLEDCDFFSVNFLHAGRPKVWYTVAPKHRRRFELLVRKMFRNATRSCPRPMAHKTIVIDPRDLVAAGIKVNRFVQYPGDYVILYPDTYHSGFNTGLNCAESVNFATAEWLPHGDRALSQVHRLVQEKLCFCRNSIAFASDDSYLYVHELVRQEMQKRNLPIKTAAEHLAAFEADMKACKRKIEEYNARALHLEHPYR